MLMVATLSLRIYFFSSNDRDICSLIRILMINTMVTFAQQVCCDYLSFVQCLQLPSVNGPLYSDVHFCVLDRCLLFDILEEL
jgi:hypothetical protein